MAGAGSAGRAAADPERQENEYAVLDELAEGDLVREERLRTATGATREVLRTLQRKKWIVREDLSGVRDARRLVKFVVLREAADGGKTHKLNPAQQRIVEVLREAQGRMRMEDLRETECSSSSLKTLVKHDLVEIVEAVAEQPVPQMKPRTTLEFLFTPSQKEALREIRGSVEERRFKVALLHGVTGSGKTAVYLAAMQSVLAAGRGSILLVPEIGLTPGVAADLIASSARRLPSCIARSTMRNAPSSGIASAAAKRALRWARVRPSSRRFSDLALIIVDEEQDHSYKQEETPRYHGRDVAVVRAKALQATVVLGSATPSLESYYNATHASARPGTPHAAYSGAKYGLIELPDRVQERPLPEVELVDMRAEFQQTGKESVLSRKLIEETTASLERGEQAMILLNRRGYSAWVMCRSCGDTIQCRDCAVAMTYHKRQQRLLCHYCGYQQAVPRLVRSAAASTFSSWARARKSWRICCMRRFRGRGLAAWIATRCAGTTTLSAC